MRITAAIGSALIGLALAGPAVAEPDKSVYESPAPSVEKAEKSDAPAAPPKPAVTLAIDIDLARQQLTVTAGGKPLHRWAVSSGTQEFPTPRGSFRPQWMARMWHSRKYDDAPMPHSIFFHGGAAIHATSSTGRLGRPASHGCVRLAPANAATLYNLVTRHGMASTRIVVHGNPKFSEPQVAQRRDRPQPRIQMARANLAPYGYGEPYRYTGPRQVIYAPQGLGYGSASPRHTQPGYGRVSGPQLMRY